MRRYEEFPVAGAEGHCTYRMEQRVLQRSIITSLADMLDASGFYYSPTYDLTHSVQRQVAFTDEQRAQASWRRADERFFWNRHIALPFIEAGLDQLVTPVMDGFISIEPSILSTNRFTYALISRRECLRTGTRYLLAPSFLLSLVQYTDTLVNVLDGSVC